MIWYRDLFVGESVSHKQKQIIRKVKKRSLFNSAYLLTLSANPDNLIDILSCQVIRQKTYPTNDLIVIGLAGDYEEACQLAGEIVSSLYAATGDFKLRDFVRANRACCREDESVC